MTLVIYMKLIEIVPFVRYALRFKFQPKTNETVSVDCRLFYITTGSGNIILNNTSHRFREGSVIIFQPGTKYKFSTKEKLEIISINFDYTADYVNQTMFFKPTSVKKSFSKNIIFHDAVIFDDCEALNSPLVIDDAYTIAGKLLDIVNENIAKSAYYREKCSALLKECIVDVLREHSDKTSTKQKLNKIKQYIKENYAEQISNEQLAKLVNYHPYYLNRIFLKSNDITLHQYLINYRISIAEQLLTTTPESVVAISQRVGFTSVAAFTVNFKKKNGMTPTKFRETFKNSI